MHVYYLQKEVHTYVSIVSKIRRGACSYNKDYLLLT